MNERIRELAEQAGVDAGQTIANTICGEGGLWVALGNEFNKLSQKTRDLIYKTLEQNQEKFAELIVRECAKIADTAEPFLASDLIKEHFGVEE
jgi:succinate dehydrogenase/fumarate reductase flavoprotein subunit